MIALMDHMFANGTLAIDGLFTPDWVNEVEGQGAGYPWPDVVHGSPLPEP